MAALPVLRVFLASKIDGLANCVRQAFAASSLQATHALELVTVNLDEPRKAEAAEVLFADPGVIMPLIDSNFPNLRWMQSTWAGVNVFVDRTSRRNYTLTRISGVFGPLMADYVMGQVLAHERGVRELAALQSAKTWDQAPFARPRKLAELTLSLLGPGDIGQTILQRAKAMGMRTVAYKRDGACVPHADETLASLPEVLARGHYVVNVLPSTPATRGLLSGAALERCDGAVLINVGRGDVVDEVSLLAALERRWLSKAVLDVFPVEPLPAESPLWSHPQIVITPHVSAPSLPGDVAAVFLANLERHARGQELDFAVAWEKGY